MRRTDDGGAGRGHPLRAGKGLNRTHPRDPGGSRTAVPAHHLLDRLHQKGYVHRRREGRQNRYSPAVTRSDLISLRLREIADELCDGSLAPLLSHLTRLSNPTAEEADALQRLVERLSERASQEEDA